MHIMTYTKRQKFIYRFKQGLNMLDKSVVYLTFVDNYMKDSKFSKRSNKILQKLLKLQKESIELLTEINGKYSKYLNERNKVV